MSDNQLIDIALATIDVMDIDFEVISVPAGMTLDEAETDLIRKLNPIYNIAKTGNLYWCPCDPKIKPYKSRRCYQKHLNDKHPTPTTNSS